MKRIVAILLSVILLMTCAVAFGEESTAEYELNLAKEAIKAMSTTIDSLTINVRIMAELLAKQQETLNTNKNAEFENFAKQIADIYEQINELAFDAYVNDIMQDIDKEINNCKPDLTIDENGNDIINDINDDDLNAFFQMLTGAVNNVDGNIMPPKDKSDPIVGGWTIQSDYAITDAMGNMVATATSDIPDMAITPIACIGTQLVAGENFCYFCRAEHQGEPGDEYTQYILLYVYVDLNGNAEVIGWATINPGKIANHLE